MPTVASIRQMDVFLPLPLAADAVNRRGDENFNLMARLKPGVTMAQAKADVSAIAARIREKDKRDRTFTIDVVPLLDRSSATCGGRCSCCSGRWRWCC